MSSRDDRDRRRAEAHGAGREAMAGRRAGFFGSLLPTGVVCRALRCSLEVPEEIVVGRPTPFHFHVHNRIPMGLVLELPSSRSWGWEVDGVPEAGVGRYDPPAESATFALGPRERRTLVGRWDGQFLEADGTRERWVAARGTHTLTAYVAVENWRGRGVAAHAEVTVRPQG